MRLPCLVRVYTDEILPSYVGMILVRNRYEGSLLNNQYNPYHPRDDFNIYLRIYHKRLKDQPFMDR